MSTLCTALIFMLTPALGSGDAAEASRLRAEVREGARALELTPTTDAELRLQRAMTRLRQLLDASFHAPNLVDPSSRPAALALRREIRRTLAGRDAVMVLRDDVVRFRPEIHRALARAARARGDDAAEVHHLRLVLAVATNDVDQLAALREAYERLGRSASAAEVSRRLAELNGG